MRILIECGSTLNEDICRNMHILYGSSLNRDPYLIGILIQKFALGERAQGGWRYIARFR